MFLCKPFTFHVRASFGLFAPQDSNYTWSHFPGKAQLLTKSKYLTGLQCHKYLWVSLNDKSKIPPTDPATQFVFDQGYEVGELAKKMFPQGINIPCHSFQYSILQTRGLISQRKPLFEASILVGDLYSRIDILNPVAQDSWDIIEVKSTTSVKEEHVGDVAFQKCCCEKSGQRIRKCHLMYLNNEYVKNGELDLNELFLVEDVSDQVNVFSHQIPARIEEMFGIIAQKNCPDVPIGMQCLGPHECPLKDQCWSFLPKRSIFNLYWLGKEKKFELLQQGIKTIEEIPVDYKLTDKQQIQRHTTQENSVHVDHEGIESFLQTLKYPLYYLDFETFSPAIPLYDGTRPYQKIPFQYSLHVVQKENENSEHSYFLADGARDPRGGFLVSLKSVVGNSGSVIVYNQKFEEGILNELAVSFPEHELWIRNVVNRMVDLLGPFQSFHYHHPDQNGSASLKNVLPVLTGQTYNAMNIKEGDEASRMFVEVFIKGCSPEKREKIKRDLEDYCCLDTQAMIDIVKKLREIVRNG